MWAEDNTPPEGNTLPPSAVVSHPGIFELVGLPKNYDTLIEECTRRKCPTKGKDITDPTICLFCGDLFCSQAVCCTKDIKEGRNKVIQLGGAQQHMRKYVPLSFDPVYLNIDHP
jgi:E3 ubiquitin-protein ligase UBR1